MQPQRFQLFAGEQERLQRTRLLMHPRRSHIASRVTSEDLDYLGSLVALDCQGASLVLQKKAFGVVGAYPVLPFLVFLFPCVFSLRFFPCLFWVEFPCVLDISLPFCAEKIPCVFGVLVAFD